VIGGVSVGTGKRKSLDVWRRGSCGAGRRQPASTESEALKRDGVLAAARSRASTSWPSAPLSNRRIGRIRRTSSRRSGARVRGDARAWAAQCLPRGRRPRCAGSAPLAARSRAPRPAPSCCRCAHRRFVRTRAAPARRMTLCLQRLFHRSRNDQQPRIAHRLPHHHQPDGRFVKAVTR